MHPSNHASDDGVEIGWRRFLERLRRLWPKRPDGEPAPARGATHA